VGVPPTDHFHRCCPRGRAWTDRRSDDQAAGHRWLFWWQ